MNTREQVYVTSADAAIELGLTRRRVSQLIRTGQLPAKRFGRAYLIRREDLDRLLRERRENAPERWR